MRDDAERVWDEPGSDELMDEDVLRAVKIIAAVIERVRQRDREP